MLKTIIFAEGSSFILFRRAPMKTKLAVVGLALALSSVSAQADLVQNGGFETGDFSGWTQTGNTGFTGVAAGVAHSGNFGAFFGAVGSLGGITQTLSTISGTSYLIDFWLQSDGGTPSRAVVTFGGNTIFDQTNLPASSYTEHSFTVAATSNSTVLSLTFRDDPGFFSLDDVSVNVASAVPEPSTWAMLLIGFAGLGFMAYRRKKIVTLQAA
jgi:PEP-CTERM motif